MDLGAPRELAMGRDHESAFGQVDRDARLVLAVRVEAAESDSAEKSLEIDLRPGVFDAEPVVFPVFRPRFPDFRRTAAENLPGSVGSLGGIGRFRLLRINV